MNQVNIKQNLIKHLLCQSFCLIRQISRLAWHGLYISVVAFFSEINPVIVIRSDWSIGYISVADGLTWINTRTLTMRNELSLWTRPHITFNNHSKSGWRKLLPLNTHARRKLTSRNYLHQYVGQVTRILTIEGLVYIETICRLKMCEPWPLWFRCGRELFTSQEFVSRISETIQIKCDSSVQWIQDVPLDSQHKLWVPARPTHKDYPSSICKW